MGITTTTVKRLEPLGLTWEEEKVGLWTMAADVAREWFWRQSRNPWGCYYLHFMPSTHPKRLGDWGHLMVLEADEEAPDGYLLVTPERFSRGRTQEQTKHWVHDMLRRLPLLPLVEG